MSGIANTQTTVFKLYHTLWTAVDWLYPPYCGGCGEFGSRWCSACNASVKPIDENICQKCGDLLPAPGLCTECLTSSPAFKQNRSWALFEGPLREAIHHLKYNQDMGLGEPLAMPLVNLLKNLGWAIDLIVPVPLSPQRQAERGYNHAALIARPLALAVNIPFSNRAIQRIHNTRTQVGLNHHQRKENVMEAFQAVNALVAKRTILLIDDVATTGATLSACAKALLAAGSGDVYGMTLARAVINQDGR